MRAPIHDTLGRPLGALRMSVTDRCNLRCSYCMPEDDYVWLPREGLLDFDELARVARLFSELGVDRIRLTGGEPLLRRGLPDLVAKLLLLETIGEVALTTNGVLLDSQAAALAAAGLRRITVSLDTLDPARFQRLTRKDEHARVLAGIDAARGAGLAIKLDTVVLRDVNDDEIIPLLRYAASIGAELRFIEYMDVGGATRWRRASVVTREEILVRVREAFGRASKRPRLGPGRDVPPAEWRLLRRNRERDGSLLSGMRPQSSDGRRHVVPVPLRGARTRPQGRAARGRNRRHAPRFAGDRLAKA